MDNTALYYDKFLTLVCEYWRDEISRQPRDTA